MNAGVLCDTCSVAMIDSLNSLNLASPYTSVRVRIIPHVIQAAPDPPVIAIAFALFVVSFCLALIRLDSIVSIEMPRT